MKFVIIILSFAFLIPAPLHAENSIGYSLEPLNGDVEYYEEESSSLWHITLKTGRARLFGKATAVSRTTCISSHRFNQDGNKTEQCIFKPRNAAVATIELSADGTDPVIVNDSIDMSHPSERTLYEYLEDGRIATSHWESIFGVEHFIGTDTADSNDAPLAVARKYVEQDSIGTKYFYFNERGYLSKIENDRNDGSISVTFYDSYRYDRYGNWIERKKYALRPDGSRVQTGAEHRRYRYR